MNPTCFRFRSLCALAALVFAGCGPVLAQNAPPKTGFTYSAAKFSYTAKGVILQGAARIVSPQLSVAATRIEFDLSGNTVSQVRATGSVDLKLNLAPQGGGASAKIQSKSNAATLQTAARTLVLSGGVSGFYQIGDGAKNTLSGEKATLGFENKNLVAQIEGGAKGVQIELPASTLGGSAAIGTLKISAQRATLDQGSGVATFSGNARAVSSGAGALRAFGATFTVQRAADGTLTTLKTEGKTLVKYDLPPDAAASASAGSFGQPTHVEVAANGAVFEGASSTATFSGAVKGFYRLQQNGAALDYPFSGDKAVISFDRAAAAATGNGLNVEVTALPGQQVVVEAPALDAGL